jgi:hypothetical protein
LNVAKHEFKFWIVWGLNVSKNDQKKPDTPT